MVEGSSSGSSVGSCCIRDSLICELRGLGHVHLSQEILIDCNCGFGYNFDSCSDSYHDEEKLIANNSGRV